MTPKGSLQIGGLDIPGATKESTATDPDDAERARRVVAEHAIDAHDRALLLAALGLVPAGRRLKKEYKPQ